MKPVDRAIVEAVKAAKKVEVVLNPTDPVNKMIIRLSPDRKLHHDIALAIQSYYINHV